MLAFVLKPSNLSKAGSLLPSHGNKTAYIVANEGSKKPVGRWFVMNSVPWGEGIMCMHTQFQLLRKQINIELASEDCNIMNL